MTKGLLAGKEYGPSEKVRGVYGLYGSFDYISPHIFRVSSTALSFGTTFQRWLTSGLVLQSSALVGIGYGAGGVTQAVGERDYHYGGTAQGTLALRFILDELGMLELTGRRYYITGKGSPDQSGSEDIGRASALLTVRVWHRHAVGLQYLGLSRNARYRDREPSHQTLSEFQLVYTLLGNTHFGTVDWRPAAAAAEESGSEHP